MLIKGKCYCTALGLYKMQYPGLLMLCWHSVDAPLMLGARSVHGHYQVKRHRYSPYCLERRPILRLWITAAIQPLDDWRCYTQNRWRSVAAHFQIGAVTMSLSLFRTKAANTLILGKCQSIAFKSYKMHHRRLLMLCWRSDDALLKLCRRSVDGLLTLCWGWLSGETTSTLTILPIKAANTLIIDKCRSVAPGWYKMQNPK
jgi:hypothetical protein